MMLIPVDLLRQAFRDAVDGIISGAKPSRLRPIENCADPLTPSASPLFVKVRHCSYTVESQVKILTFLFAGGCTRPPTTT
jgi:hypothetical protein